MSFLERKAIRQRIYKKYENLDRSKFLLLFIEIFDYYDNKSFGPDVWTYDL